MHLLASCTSPCLLVLATPTAAALLSSWVCLEVLVVFAGLHSSWDGVVSSQTGTLKCMYMFMALHVYKSTARRLLELSHDTFARLFLFALAQQF